MAEDKNTTSLKDFLAEESLPPAPGQRPLNKTFEDQPNTATESMGTFLDAVGADLGAPPPGAEPQKLHDPLDRGEPAAEPEDHRAFLASMGVPVTPAPVQRRAAGKVIVDSAKKAGELAQKNWVPAILMTIAITVIFFYIIGIFKLPS
ncbi:MAG: hypothetical protein KC912_04310 [Proteobacteria bacterium]|nr:hypothetical protein [Pseudomonadota bacterium]